MGSCALGPASACGQDPGTRVTGRRQVSRFLPGKLWGAARRTKVAVHREDEGMSEPRVIKKYPNRRLYDTVQSKYITLADVRKLVVERIEFMVVDKKSQEDITRSILLQVIAEQEHAGEPLMSRDFLSQIIRSYGGAMQGMLGSYLEQSLKLF